MPLTQPHKDFIQISTSHLIPTDPSSAGKLTKAFEHKIEDPNDEPFYTIQNIFANPPMHLLGLENQDKSSTPFIGEVREHFLATTVQSCPFQFEHKHIVENLKLASDHKTEFKSERGHIKADPYEVLESKSQIERLFQKKLVTNTDFMVFQTEITIQVPPNHNSEKTIELEEFDADQFETDDERHQYLLALEDTAEKKAIQETAEIALNRLVKEKIISAEEAKNAGEGARKMITYSFWFNLIRNKQFTFDSIKDINNSSADTLVSPNIIYLIEQKICKINGAKRLSYRVLENSFYFARVCQMQTEQKHNELDELKSLTEEQTKNLLCNQVIRLIGLGKLTIPVAKGMSKGCRLLFEKTDNDAFLQLMESDKLEFKKIKNISEDKAKNLCTYVISNLILKGALSIDAALPLKISDAQRAVLDNEYIFKLIQNGSLDLQFILNNLEEHQCRALSTLSIAYLIFNKTISLDYALGLHITEDCQSLLNNATYFELIRKGKLDLRTLLENQELCPALLKDETIKAINKGKIDIKIILANKKLHDVLLDDEALKAINNDEIRWLALFKDETITAINNGKIDLKKILANKKLCPVLLKDEILKAIIDGDIHFDSFFERIKDDSVIVNLLTNNLLLPTEIFNFVPRDPLSFLEFKPIPKDNETNRKIMKEFAELARYGLLFEEDLSIVFQKIEQIRATLQVKEEKKSSGFNISLKILSTKLIFDACVANIEKRLDAIYNEDPILLFNKTKDSLHRVINSAQKFKINSLNAWAKIFGLRLAGVHQDFPHMIGGQIDNINFINKDILHIAGQFKFSEIELKNQAIKYFLQKCINDLEARSTWDKSISKLHKIISVECEKASDIEKRKWGTPTLDMWSHALANIIQNSQQALPKSNSKSLGFFDSASYVTDYFAALNDLAKGLDKLKSTHAEASSLRCGKSLGAMG